jgi:Tyrosine phosphatase family
MWFRGPIGRRRLWLGFSGVAILFLAQQIWRHGSDYVFAERFAIVEPGRVYRGAWLKDWPMRRVVRDHKIKTVVALAHPEDDPWVESEQALGKELGFRFIHVPIVDDRSNPDGKLLYDRLEQAAAEIANPDNQPVFFHCHHGINRASMVQMAYRVLYCDWTLEQAEDEIARTFGLREVDKGPDYRHMAGFYRDRVLPRRQAQARALVETGPAPLAATR